MPFAGHIVAEEDGRDERGAYKLTTIENKDGTQRELLTRAEDVQRSKHLEDLAAWHVACNNAIANALAAFTIQYYFKFLKWIKDTPFMAQCKLARFAQVMTNQKQPKATIERWWKTGGYTDYTIHGFIDGNQITTSVVRYYFVTKTRVESWRVF